jgi:hypothetical protein
MIQSTVLASILYLPALLDDSANTGCNTGSADAGWLSKAGSITSREINAVTATAIPMINKLSR